MARKREGALRLAVCTVSLGRAVAGHTLPTKFAAARRAGIDGVELTFECLEDHARRLHATIYSDDRHEAIRKAALDVRGLATEHELEIVALSPFMNYDALSARDVIDGRLAEAKLWFQVCNIVRAPYVQVPSTIFPTTDIDRDLRVLAANMRRLATMAQQYGVALSYEAPSWGEVLQTWEQIEEVRRLSGCSSSIKHCLDTFHIAGYEAGEPESSANGGLRRDGPYRLQRSLERLKATLQASDIAYFQLSDACGVDLSQDAYPVKLPSNAPAQMIWSRNCRVPPLDTDRRAILPIVSVARTVFEIMGYEGWCSMECFHPDMYDTRPSVPLEWARASAQAWMRLLDATQSNEAR